MSHRGGLALLAATALGCGAMETLERLDRGMGVAAGDVDEKLLGTYRIKKGTADLRVGTFELLVLRSDLTFHGVYVGACPDRGCGPVSLEGTYRQVRQMPNPTRASAVVLAANYRTEAGVVHLSMRLERGWVEGSERISLYRAPSGAPETNPAFQLLHGEECWCADEMDCLLQRFGCTIGVPACSAGACACE